MKRILLVAVSAVLLIAGAGGFWFWNEMQKPLYTPGMVRAGTNLRAPLDPPPGNGTTADEGFWQVEPDIRLHYLSLGSGEPVLVVHGGPGLPFAEIPEGFAPLAERYRLYFYDQRGCGQSSRPVDRLGSSNFYENMQSLDRTLGLGAQIADLERIRRILGRDKIILVGHSFGGFLASLYAAEFPEHVESLVLVAPADLLVMPPADGGLFESLKPLLPEEERAGYDSFMKGYLDYNALWSKSDAEIAELNGTFARFYETAANRKGYAVPAGPPASSTGGWMGHAMYLSMGLKHDYRAALRQVTAPVLVLHGENDIQPVPASRAYADAFPHSEMRVVAGAGHFVFDDQRAVFASAVREFLDRSALP